MPITPHTTPPPPPSHEKQRALNESWPISDKDGHHARGIADQPYPIDVVVRVEWEHDGVEHIEATATRWTASHVFCRWVEPRLPINGLWVRAHDVERRNEREPHRKA